MDSSAPCSTRFEHEQQLVVHGLVLGRALADAHAAEVGFAGLALALDDGAPALVEHLLGCRILVA